MKHHRNPAVSNHLLQDLRKHEKELVRQPSTEGYLKLADEYRLLGMGKESDRLLQLAEAIESGERVSDSQTPVNLLSGTATPVMVVEIIQILSRTKLSGEFIIHAPGENYSIFFDHGHIINASTSNQKYAPGLESFHQAMRVPQGTYHFVQKAVTNEVRLIDGQTEILLLNAMQDADESATI